MIEDDEAGWEDIEDEEEFSRYGSRAERRPRRRVWDETDEGSGFETTYQPSRHEAGWLLASLRPFYEQRLISDVLALVKGGKEASVYRCRAGESAPGDTLLAAKVYRPRQFRNLRNDKMYREGREILTPDGNPVKRSDHRILRALGKKTAFGEQVKHTSWLMHEYTTLERLHQAGAAVPRPLGAGENAVLMTYQGDAAMAAPALSEVALETDEAAPLFEEIRRNIALMLGHGLIHGDLSAYNVLYWEGRVTLIDFPQVANCHANPSARFLLGRDIARVCEYFARQGVRRDPVALLDELWERYVGTEDLPDIPDLTSGR